MRKARKVSTAAKPISRGLKKAIQRRHLTAYATAKQADVSVDAVQRFMNDERGLTLGTIDKIADALDLKLCEEEPAKDEK